MQLRHVGTIVLCLSMTIGADIIWKGDLSLDSRIRLNDPHELERQEYRLTLGCATAPGGHSRFSSTAVLRYLREREGDVHSFADVQSVSKLLPLDLIWREAVLDVYGLGIEGLDIRLGRQRIGWGRADRINPTNNIDPPDMEDVWDLGRRLPSDAVFVRYFRRDFSLEGVYTPFFRPALLPRGEWLDIFYQSPSLPSSYAAFVTLDEPRDTIPPLDPRPIVSSSGAVRLQGRLTALDFSLSYTYARQHIPVISHATVTPRGVLDLSGPLPATVTVELLYPRTHVAGADAAWQIGEVGMWAEAGLFVTEKVVTEATIVTDGMIIPDGVRPFLALVPDIAAALEGRPLVVDTPLTGKPYAKWVVGADYTFPHNLYVNVQYSHGLSHEYGSKLGDYFFVESRWSVWQERLEIAPFSCVVEVADWDQINKSWAAVWLPKLIWKPVDNVSLSAGMRLLWGGSRSTFGRMARHDHAWIRAEYSF